MKKTICISIPCYNEVENVVPLCETIIKTFKENLEQYDYIIQLIDNKSTDGTRDKIQYLCSKYKQIRAIFNVKNFPRGSAFHGLMMADGDCTIFMPCDFQGPPELIPEFVKKWEQGYKIVCGIKKAAQECHVMFGIRKIYYKLIKLCAKLENIEYIEQFTGFGLYDKEFMDFIRKLGDPMPFMRSIVAEYGYKICYVDFVQPKRKKGRSKINFYDLYDSAMRSFTMNTKVGVRLSVFVGILFSTVSFITIILSSILALRQNKKVKDSNVNLGSELFFVSGIILTFLGIMGEYILAINTRVMKHPFVIEERRINFDKNQSK